MRASLVSRYRALVIAGPTAVGKSEFAVQAALRANGEIVGADAFQVYQGLELLTAKPSLAQQQAVRHHLIGEIPRSRSFDVAQYLDLAGQRMAEIRRRGKTPVIVGGTGLYVRALMRGLDDLPPANPAIRAELETQPLEALQQRLKELDPVAASRIDLKNPRRVIRALEVCLTSGKPFSSFGQEWNTAPTQDCGVLLLRDRAELYARIEQRVEEMFRDGVIEEVERAGTEMSPTAEQTLGWREIRSLIAGEMTRDACIAAIQQSTRQYAKRQITWFRRETGLRTIEMAGGQAMEEFDKLLAESSD